MSLEQLLKVLADPKNWRACTRNSWHLETIPGVLPWEPAKKILAERQEALRQQFEAGWNACREAAICEVGHLETGRNRHKIPSGWEPITAADILGLLTPPAAQPAREPAKDGKP